MEDRFTFRIWHREMEEYFYPIIDSENESREYTPFIFEIGFKLTHESDSFDFQQCLGVGDAESIMVYEGDIVELDGGRAEIIYEHAYGGFCFNVIPSTENDWIDDWGIHDLYRMKIIGNNKENPELLN